MSEARPLLAPGSPLLAAIMLAGAGVYLFLPASGIATFGAIAYGVAGGVWPALALRLVGFSTPFYLLPKAAADLPFNPTEFLLFWLAAGWFAWRLRRATRGERLDLGLGRPEWPILLFLLGAVLAGLAATDLAAHARGLRLLVLEPLVFFWLARRVLVDDADWHGLLDAWLLAGVAVSFFAFYQYLFTQDTIVAEGVARARGLYGSPNNLGIYLARLLPVAGALAFWGVRRPALYGAAFVAIALALGLTFSLGAWLGAAAGLLCLAVVGGQRRLALGVVAVLALAVLAGSAVGLERITSHFSPDSPTWRWRSFVWQAGLSMVRDHPLMGIGIDNFLRLYPNYMHPDAWPEPNLSHPHNLVLDFWLSTGLVGLVGGLWLLGRQAKRAWQLWQSAPAAQTRALGLGLLASAVVLLVQGSFDNSYFLIDLAFVFWLGQALVAPRRQVVVENVPDDEVPNDEEREAAPWEAPRHRP
ncbi:MAG: O-antigen ligase family protein [Chloroflexota bacterium]